MVFQVLDKINEMLNTSPSFILRMTGFLTKFECIENGVVESVKYVKHERTHYDVKDIKKKIEEVKKYLESPDYIEITIAGEGVQYTVTITEEMHIAAEHGFLLVIREHSRSENSPDKMLHVLILIGLSEDLRSLVFPAQIDACEGSAAFTYVTEKSAKNFILLGYYLILPCFFNLYISLLYPNRVPFGKFPKGIHKQVDNTFNNFYNFLESIKMDEIKDILSDMVKTLITTLKNSEKYSYEKHIKKLEKYL